VRVSSTSAAAQHRGRAQVALAAVLVAGLILAVLTGCQSGPPNRPGASGATASGPAATPTTSPATPTSSTTPAAATTRATPTTGAGNNGASPAPSWLGRRVLKIGSDGFGIAGSTPVELRNRRIITTDFLPAPSDGRFHARIEAVPDAVVKRSSWSSKCPVALSHLRYVTVGFRGFDGHAHTGELLVNSSVASDVVTVFRELFAAGWPIEEMRITSQAELSAPPTGDGNDTSAFACRPVRGQMVWSQHALGLAVDVDPFQNPYVDGRTVLPELAKWYTNRGRGAVGMITAGSVPVRIFRSVGWGWGGNYSSKKDWMHFSSTGG